MLRPREESERAQVEDALVDGDVAYQRGTAQAALRHRDFRIVYGGTFASNVGTWMQNVILGAYALDLTKSGGFVSLMFFAQLGPLLFLSTIGGALADTVDRRRLLVGLQLLQGALSVVLARLVWGGDPSRPLLVALVFAIGIANALGAPGLSSILPTLVPKADLPGAVALMSVQMNLSRVIGPAIGGIVYHAFDAGPVFALNAATYGFAVTGLLVARYNRRLGAKLDEQGLARLLSGVRIARRDPLIRHLLLTLFSFSFFSLAFVGIMPVIAKYNLGIAPKSNEYGWLYATFGLGAALGAITVGTVLAHRSKEALLRPGFVAFAVVLAGFGLLRDDVAAFPVVALLGYVYFVVITCLSTVLQQHLRDEVRGRVMALWIMGFGGTVPVGVLVAGPFSKDHSTEVLLVGAAWALLLALWSNARVLYRKGTGRGGAADV
jgi:MFS family permease